jgi:RES domain-containing protein
MLAWKIAKRAYALDRTGTGSRIAGGRWNSEGISAIYAGLTAEIAAMEKLVHTGRFLPADLVVVRIALPDDHALYETPNPMDLPTGWAELPSSPAAIAFGDAFIQRMTKLGLIIPSAVMPEARNILINPAHPAMAQVTIEVARDFAFDPRLRP